MGLSLNLLPLKRIQKKQAKVSVTVWQTMVTSILMRRSDLFVI